MPGPFSSPDSIREDTQMLEAYRAHVAERAALGIPPLPLTKQQTRPGRGICSRVPPTGEASFLMDC